jgi:hypothetical protein
VQEANLVQSHASWADRGTSANLATRLKMAIGTAQQRELEAVEKRRDRYTPARATCRARRRLISARATDCGSCWRARTQ